VSFRLDGELIFMRGAASAERGERGVGEIMG